MFGRVNIIQGGKLVFIEPAKERRIDNPGPGVTDTGQDFWATSIIVENGGELLAGVPYKIRDPQTRLEKEVPINPYGTTGKSLRFHLYGKDPRAVVTDSEGPGQPCVQLHCGVQNTVWTNNQKEEIPDLPQDPAEGPKLPGIKVKDFFYKYGPLHGDTKADDESKQGYFGYKVLAVSYGGTLRLRGLKGTTGTSGPEIATLLKTDDELKKDSDAIACATKVRKPEKAPEKGNDAVLNCSGTDWARLTATDKTSVTLDRTVSGDWKDKDEVVVTSTDYFPEHSELRQIAGDPSGTVVKLSAALEFPHSATAYDVGKRITTADTAFRAAVVAADGGKPENPFLDKAETRAAVALLTRSIRIMSEGDAAGDTFDDATNGRAKTDKDQRPAVPANKSYMYGGHVVFRQGFAQLQIQGVEFKQLGQGGFLGRYPVHFHIARRVPPDTYLIDSSVNESMTRWVVIHSTIGVTVARDVGWKSIGHGFFLEDATETDNKFYSDIGIYARGSAQGGDNTRNIPGLLDAANEPFLEPLKYHSDANYPSVFWITNGWNSFVGNMAAGAGTCGACYWYVPAGNHDMIEQPGDRPMLTSMQWSGYSKIQASPAGPGSNERAGLSPVKLFYKNYCSSAMHSLSVTDETPCQPLETRTLPPVENKRAPPAPSPPQTESDDSKGYYPRYTGLRDPTICDPTITDSNDAKSCAKAKCDFNKPTQCVPSIFSHYTSSFNFAGTNFSAIWLRSSYLLLDHAFLSDVLGPGVTIVTGGDYSRSNLPVGYWGLTTNSIFAGMTQPGNAFTREKGPIPNAAEGCAPTGPVCLSWKSGVGFPTDNFGTGQRLYNVYDGPAYEHANAFLDVYPSLCNTEQDCMYYARALGIRKAAAEIKSTPDTIMKGSGFLPNAAIAWKQSNGFYYPPAFHSSSLLFVDAAIRHYVIEPLTFPGTYRTDPKKADDQYVKSAPNMFNNFSDVDRQTELSDDDGSLTGLVSTGKFEIRRGDTVSVNEDPFFSAPTQTAECRSNVGIDASNACRSPPAPPPVQPSEPPTARTSPYDHITTALYPADTALWTRECSNENCTGVPIYRQYLTGEKGPTKDKPGTREWARWVGNDCDTQLKNLQGKIRTVPTNDPYQQPTPLTVLNPPNATTPNPVAMTPIGPALTPDQQAFIKFDSECPGQFVRMAGMNLYQRSVLTVDNGTYFIDTTQSEDFQRKTFALSKFPYPRNINVFGANKTYWVYFLFAKSTTKQTYQIYGGPGFGASNISGIKVNVSVMPLPDKAVTVVRDAQWIKAEPVAGSPDTVAVTVDFKKAKDAGISLDPKHLKAGKDTMDETCQPHDFCKKSEGENPTCTCDDKKLGVLGLLNPAIKNVCKNICEEWAVKDLDCPEGGCLGFQFTLSKDFQAKDQMIRPKPTDPDDKSWTRILTQTKTVPDNQAGGSKASSCFYPTDKIPNDSTGNCKVAD